MSALRLILGEMRHRWLTFGLGVLAVAAAAGLLVALATTGRASNLETKRLMRDLGFNLLIVPRGTNLADFWAKDFVAGDMPEAYVARLAETAGLGADHYVATLEQKIAWRGLEVLLTGVLPERSAVDAPKKEPMGYKVEPGTCLVGFAVAEALDLKRGDTVDLNGQRLQVKRVLLEEAGKEDIRLYVHLRAAQQILHRPGRINAIQALGCLCYGVPLSVLRNRVARVLPDTYCAELRTIATARSETRHMVERYVGFIVSAVISVCALWVGLLALLNVRERRREIGILRALGFGSGPIAAVFLGRAVLIGLLGAAVGFALGTGLALHWGPGVFKITFAKVRPVWDLLGPTLAASALVAALASFVPAMAAVTQDPAVTLTEE